MASAEDHCAHSFVETVRGRKSRGRRFEADEVVRLREDGIQEIGV
jgi:hypothetical protein